jgi:hypothetical protein
MAGIAEYRLSPEHFCLILSVEGEYKFTMAAYSLMHRLEINANVWDWISMLNGRRMHRRNKARGFVKRSQEKDIL